jgi:cytochrome oxidase Cu insertion factor (SCO1/SenC/PrrC family)
VSNESAPKTNRRTLILLLVLLCAPVIASYLLYFWEVRPASINYGELLKVKPMTGTGLNQLDNTIFRFRQLRGKWVLLTVDSGKCDEQCQKKLYYMRQVRLVQNKEMNRVERVWLIDDGEAPDPKILNEFKNSWFISAKDSEMLGSIPAEISQHDHIYLIDPMGNLMMRFPKNPDPAKMVKDLKRLLQVSQMEHAMGSADTKH